MSQLARLRGFQTRNAGRSEACLAKLRQAVTDNQNVFAVMMDAVRHCMLGQISKALYGRRPVSAQHVAQESAMAARRESLLPDMPGDRPSVCGARVAASEK